GVGEKGTRPSARTPGGRPPGAWSGRGGRRGGRGGAGGGADPPFPAGPACCVTVLTATIPSDRSASQWSRRRPLLARLRGDPYVPILLSCALACWSMLEGSGA